MADGPFPARPQREIEASFAFGAWLAFLLVLARGLIVFALELAHHGDADLAGLRLANAFPPLVLGGFALALAAILGAWGAALAARARLVPLVVPLALAAVMFLYLSGRMDGDPSRRIGTDTPLGRIALALAGVAALALAAFFFLAPARGRLGRLAGSWSAVLAPLALLGLAGAYLRLAHTGLDAAMDVRRFERELVGETWEVLRAHPQGHPEAGVLCPSVRYTPDGAARPSLVLPPPARVRRVLPDTEGDLWLVGGAGLDHAPFAPADEGAAELYRGHSVRLRVHVDGVRAAEATLSLADARRWADLGGGDGLRVRGGASIELESTLLDADGREVVPDLPVRAGFGGLALESRARIARTRASPERPNIVLVLLDTLRADRTSTYGYARATTPHLDALAQRGTRFEEACATASWTWPSTASILTGLYPEQHGVEDAASSFLSPRFDTLPEALQRAGFTTAGWSGSPLIVPDKGFDQGFEFFDASREGRMRRSDIVVPGALEWLAAARPWRFFLYLHLMEPHAPYVPLEEGRALFAPDVPLSFEPRKCVDYAWELQRNGFDASGGRRTESVVTSEEQRWISDLYDGSVWSADSYLGLVLARLEELGLAENTIVAVTSDHGEELFDRGLLSHAHTLHRELVRVPLVLAGPGIPQGEVVGVPLSNVALAPTLARLAGAELELEAEADGLDLLHAGGGDTILFSTRQGWWNGVAWQPILGLRQGSRVLHFAPEGAPWGERRGSGGGEGELRVYDLARDPGERRDLAALEPERARAMRDELMRRLASFGQRRIESGGVPDQGTLELMRALGYIGK